MVIGAGIVPIGQVYGLRSRSGCRPLMVIGAGIVPIGGVTAYRGILLWNYWKDG